MKSGKKMKVPPDILSFLRKEDRFFIATHINPEGDALGSSVALSLALQSMGKTSVVYDRDGVPEMYRFLPGHERVRNSVQNRETSSYNLVLLDCNSPDRAGIEGIPFQYACVIDHHETESDFGDLKWIEPYAAATGMMVFPIIRELGVKITSEIATNLYTAIAIDTGTFRYANTTAEVLRVAAELEEAGAHPALIANSLYESWSERRFRLLLFTLNTLEIRDNVAFIVVTQDMYKRTGTSAEDTENFPGFPCMIKDIAVSAFLREIGENHWKVSLRSKGDLNVASIAVLFQGGGHKNAAGFRIKAPLESAKESIRNALARLKLLRT